MSRHSDAIIPNAAWRATEVNLGVICANAPIARPLYLFYKGRLNALRTPTQSGGSRLWPGSSKRSWGIQKMYGPEPGTGYTEASAEMGLPIQGYMMKDGKRDSHWLAMAEREQDSVEVRDKATVRDAFD